MKRLLTTTLIALGIAGFSLSATAAGLLDGYAAEAKAQSPAFTGFSAERGKALFLAKPGTGKPDTPSCTTCHTADPKSAGQARTGKAIDPMAVSVMPNRYGDLAKAEKWFTRNCNSVLGRPCTATEKGDFITFMLGQ